MSGPKSKAMADRFWKFVSPEPNSGCWLWEGSTDKRGYGQLRLSSSGPGSLAYATHVSLALAGRHVPSGKCACHHCDNPPCVNPDHLFIGTQLDNMRDAKAKGRMSPPPLSIAGRRTIRTVCVNGHEMSDANTYVMPSGWTACRACRLAAKRRYRAGLSAVGAP